MIPRIQKQSIIDKLKSNKLVLIQGPRKVGKRKLIEGVLIEINELFVSIDCSNKVTKRRLSEDYSLLKTIPGFVVLHDAQYLKNLNQLLEAVLMGEIKATVIVCCSFRPKVKPELLEALRLEGLEVNLFAPSFYESAQHFGLPEEDRLLEERLIYGNYPEVLADLKKAEITLNEIIQDAIFTNLSGEERINKGDKLMRMLQLLAFNIGDTVSYNDIAERCGLDNETVERYIYLLEDAFILYRIPSYHNGHRYELKKSNVVYFADNGVRNVLIRNFNPTFLRNDMNELWRNYVIADRLKWLKMNGIQKDIYFWKTHTNQQMDFLEVGKYHAVAYKTDWEKRKKIKFPKWFSDAYPKIKTSVINRSTYWKFLTQKN
jgi:predicted AAA+ superfamily ATPase